MADQPARLQNQPGPALPEPFVGELVVIDTDSRFSFVGTLASAGAGCVTMTDVRVIDMSSSRITLDQSLVECMTYGVSPNRSSVWISSDRIISVSLLADVIDPLTSMS
jgi:hypothetical protein